MAALALQQMAEHGNVGVDRVQQPEVRDIRGGEVGQALVLLAPAARELRAFGGENLEDAVDQAAQVVAGAHFEQRRHEARIQAEAAGLGLLHVGDAQRGAAFAGFVLGQQAQVLARDLDGLFAHAGVVVADSGDFRQVARTRRPAQSGDVQALVLVIRNGEIEVEISTSGSKYSAIDLEGGGWSGPGNLEGKPVRKDARGARDRQLPVGQQFLVEHDFVEAPGAELQRLYPEVHAVFQELVLKLQMLGRQKSAFAPKNGL